MSNNIWSELNDIKYGEIYLTKYLSFQKSLKKTFNILTLVLSVSGIFGWKYFEEYAWIAFFLIAIMQLFSLIENQLIRTDNEIDDILRLRMLYSKYFNQIERIWMMVESDQISQKESIAKFLDLRDSDWLVLEELDNKLDIKQWGFIESKTQIETNIYIKKHHYNE